MKKLRYAVEIKNIYAYIFIIFIVILVIGTIKTTIDTRDMNAFYAGMLGVVVMTAVLYIIFFPEAKRKFKERKRLKEIKEKGIKVEGNIIDYKTYSTRNSEFKNVIDGSHYYTVIVEYVDPHTKEKTQYETPGLSFDAHHCLGSKKCSVYVYEKEVYVTDFIPVNKGEENIWTKENGYYNDTENVKSEEVKKIMIGQTIIAILFTLIGLFIVFWNMYKK